jgi:hypothetical protein
MRPGALQWIDLKKTRALLLTGYRRELPRLLGRTLGRLKPLTENFIDVVDSAPYDVSVHTFTHSFHDCMQSSQSGKPSLHENKKYLAIFEATVIKVTVRFQDFIVSDFQLPLSSQVLLSPVVIASQQRPTRAKEKSCKMASEARDSEIPNVAQQVQMIPRNECLQKINFCGLGGKTQTSNMLIICTDKESVSQRKLCEVKDSRS